MKILHKTCQVDGRCSQKVDKYLSNPVCLENVILGVELGLVKASLTTFSRAVVMGPGISSLPAYCSHKPHFLFPHAS